MSDLYCSQTERYYSTKYRVDPGDRNHRFDKASVFLSPAIKQRTSENL